MEHDYFEDKSIDGDSSIDAYSKWTIAEATVSNLSKIKIDKPENKPPKPIMVRKIYDAVELAATLEKDCDLGFLVEISGNWAKIIANTFVAKTKITEYLKEHKFQFYVIPDTSTPMKVAIRELPKYCNTENIQKEILDKGFGVIKVVQMTSPKDTRILQYFLMHLERNENSIKI